MDLESYRYRDFISDLSGQDIKKHDNDPKLVIKNVRDFLVTNSRRISIAGSEYITGRYNKFNIDLPSICEDLHKDILELTFLEYSEIVSGWIKSKPL